VKHIIAETSCTVKTPSGEVRDVQVRIGCPYQISETEAACPVAVDGLYENIPDIHGIDTFQALILAIEFVRSIMTGLNSRGYVIEDEMVPLFMDPKGLTCCQPSLSGMDPKSD
jgi:hypothetical protein